MSHQHPGIRAHSSEAKRIPLPRPCPCSFPLSWVETQRRIRCMIRGTATSEMYIPPNIQPDKMTAGLKHFQSAVPKLEQSPVQSNGEQSGHEGVGDETRRTSGRWRNIRVCSVHKVTLPHPFRTRQLSTDLRLRGNARRLYRNFVTTPTCPVLTRKVKFPSNIHMH